MGLNEDADKMAEWLTEEQITNILLQRMDADEAQWNPNFRPGCCHTPLCLM